MSGLPVVRTATPPTSRPRPRPWPGPRSAHPARPDRGRVSDRSGPPDPRLRQLGVRIRGLREAQGLSLEDLAHRAGIGVRQLARVENGRGSPSVIWLFSLATGLGTHPAQLLID